MNKVIRGKRYDTSTAESISEIEVSTGRREELYRKRTGEFFLAHWTQWEKEESWIEPLDTEEAKEWVSENCDGDTYENLFGEVGEGEKKTVCISLTEQEAQKIKAYALERKISVSEAIGKLIRNL